MQDGAREQGILRAAKRAAWVALVALLLVFILHRPPNRFEMNQQDENIALDRQTGKLCRTVDFGHNSPLPLCSDLVRWWQR